MKLLILALALSCQGWGSIAFVNCAKNTATSGSTVAVSATIPNGDTAVVGGSTATTNTLSSVTDNGTSSYTIQATASNNAPKPAIATSLSISGSPTTVTGTMSGTCNAFGNGTCVVIVCWFSGVSSIGNVGASVATTASNNPNFALTMQDANNYNVCIGAISSGTVDTWSNNQGTLRFPTTGNTQLTMFMASNTQAGTGSLTCGATDSTSSRTWQAAAVELRSGAAATCAHTLTLLGAGCALLEPKEKKYYARR